MGPGGNLVVLQISSDWPGLSTGLPIPLFGQLDGSRCPVFSRRRTAPSQKEPGASQDDEKACHPITLYPRDFPLERIWQLLPDT